MSLTHFNWQFCSIFLLSHVLLSLESYQHYWTVYTTFGRRFHLLDILRGCMIEISKRSSKIWPNQLLETCNNVVHSWPVFHQPFPSTQCGTCFGRELVIYRYLPLQGQWILGDNAEPWKMTIQPRTELPRRTLSVVGSHWTQLLGAGG